MSKIAFSAWFISISAAEASEVFEAVDPAETSLFRDIAGASLPRLIADSVGSCEFIDVVESLLASLGFRSVEADVLFMILNRY